MTLNDVKVIVDEVKVVNWSCVELSWQLIGQRGAAVDWLRVQYWSVVSSTSQRRPSSVLVQQPLSTTEYLLCGLDANTRYGLCIQPVYTSGLLGKCSRTRQVSPSHEHGMSRTHMLQLHHLTTRHAHTSPPPSVRNLRSGAVLREGAGERDTAPQSEVWPPLPLSPKVEVLYRSCYCLR